MSEFTPSSTDKYPITYEQTGATRLFLKFMNVAPFHGGDLERPARTVRILSSYCSAYVLTLNSPETEFALIDAGADQDAAEILRYLEYKNAGPEAVRAIFVTHGHSDHTAGLGQFPAATVYVGEGDHAFIEGAALPDGVIPRLKGHQPRRAVVPAERVQVLRDGETVGLGEREFVAYEVPGHTKGSLAFRVDEALFSGDAVTFAPDGRAQKPPLPLSRSVSQAVRSLGVLARRLDADGVHIEAVIPNHSGEGSLDAVRALTMSE